MDLSKLGDINPYQKELSTTIHIVGCGSVGSCLLYTSDAADE